MLKRAYEARCPELLTFGRLRHEGEGAILGPHVLARPVDPDVRRLDLVFRLRQTEEFLQDRLVQLGVGRVSQRVHGASPVNTTRSACQVILGRQTL